jgi:probable addiction module antidote protein
MTKSSIMANKTYAQWRQGKLTEPARAVRYLRAAYRDSNEAFLHAVKNVIQANQVTKIAREVGMARESIYRSFSEDGNPAYLTLKAVLDAIGLEFDFKEKEGMHGNIPPSTPPESKVRHGSRASITPKISTMHRTTAPNVISIQFGVGKVGATLDALASMDLVGSSVSTKGIQQSATGKMIMLGSNPTQLAPIECVVASQDEAKGLANIYG